MKAVRIHKFDGAYVLKVEDIERPVSAEDELLAEVFTNGVNPVDRIVRKGHYTTPITGLPAIFECHRRNWSQRNPL